MAHHFLCDGHIFPVVNVDVALGTHLVLVHARVLAGEEGGLPYTRVLSHGLLNSASMPLNREESYNEHSQSKCSASHLGPRFTGA